MLYARHSERQAESINPSKIEMEGETALLDF